MDEDIQKSIRNLGRGFHAGQFSTRQVLEIMQISRIYITSGILHGVFFSPTEVVAAVKHYEEGGYLIRKNAHHQLEKWAQGEKPEDITLHCSDANEWFPPENRGKSDLDITVIDLKHPSPTCCADNKSVTQLSGSVTSTICPNEKCQEIPCVQHIVSCRGCEKDLCPGCVATWVDGNGKSVDVFATDAIADPMCAECHPECFFDDPCDKCQED